MTNKEAAYILDPETTRQALAPYALDCKARMAVVNEACAVAAKALRETGWISVKDKMPGRYETVLIAISTVNGYGDPAKLVTIGGYDHIEKRWEQYTSTDRQLCQGETVTHWMPMPKAAEG